MEFRLGEAREVLESTPRVLRAMLDGLSESWTMSSYGPGTFSPFDVLGHLIDGEHEDWIPRARRILEDGESRAFEPFDHGAAGASAQGRTVGARLDEFDRLRAESLRSLDAMRIDEGMLDRRGRHPALGVVTLRQLLATWAAHDLHHRGQIAKAMAFQYRDEVGPWRAYLSILGRIAHEPGVWTRDGVEVSRATIEDVPVVAPMFDAYRVFYKKASDPEASAAFLRDRLARGESVVYVARVDGRACGFTQLYPLFVSSAMRRSWLLNDLYVDPGARRKGVGRALLDRAVEFARGDGAAKIELRTAQDNAPAQELYERAGWEWDQSMRTYRLLL